MLADESYSAASDVCLTIVRLDYVSLHLVSGTLSLGEGQRQGALARALSPHCPPLLIPTPP